MTNEPIAWMVYTLDGTSVCVTDNPADFTPAHRALPLYTTPPQQQAEPPEWLLIKNILDEYGLQAISFVAEWKAAQQQAESHQSQWVGLTDEDFLEACQIAERGNYLLALQRIQIKLKERNND